MRGLFAGAGDLRRYRSPLQYRLRKTSCEHLVPSRVGLTDGIRGNGSQGGIVRKCLGVLAAGAALCVISWAQAPPATPDPAATQAPAPAAAPTQAPDAPLPSAPMPHGPTPAQLNRDAAPKFARIEWFGGYSYGETGFFNAGH